MFTRNYNGYAVVIVETTDERGFAVMVVTPRGNQIHAHTYTQDGAFRRAHEIVDNLRK
jgi:hypothetical protein